MSQAFTMYLSGGNSYSARARARTRRVFSRHAVDLTTDLHSMGQFIQDGARIMFETVINVEESPEEVVSERGRRSIPDGMNYLAGKSVDFVNKSAMNGTILAHTDGQVPNLMVNVPEQNEFYLGRVVLFLRVCLRHQRISAGCQPIQPARC